MVAAPEALALLEQVVADRPSRPPSLTNVANSIWPTTFGFGDGRLLVACTWPLLETVIVGRVARNGDPRLHLDSRPAVTNWPWSLTARSCRPA
jgi:hypothetical protein